ncbi:MAG: response regulator transcription factor [Pseudomonadota bacterium]
MRLLIVEDQPDLAATIGDFLELNQHQVDFAATGEAALRLVEENEYDAVLLDINLPRKDGLTVCSELRTDGNAVPVLMVTARDTVDDIVAGLDRGADDYLVKPFALEEMLARLQAVTARGRRKDTGSLQIADLEIDLINQTAQRNGCGLKLNPLQFKLLKTLALASPGVVSRETLESCLWRDDIPEPGALRMQIHRLRSVVDEAFDRPLIETVRGHGFRLNQ